MGHTLCASLLCTKKTVDPRHIADRIRGKEHDELLRQRVSREVLFCYAEPQLYNPVVYDLGRFAAWSELNMTVRIASDNIFEG